MPMAFLPAGLHLLATVHMVACAGSIAGELMH
jgi:hypothetical protein